MSLSRRMMVVAFAGMAVLALTLTMAGPEDQAVIDKIDSLEKRIVALERSLSAKLTSIEKKIGSGAVATAPVNNELENQARSAYGQINALVKAGDYDKAKTEMATFLKKYGSTKVARQAQRLSGELAVIGKKTPSNWGIESWFQGEGDVKLDGDKTTLLIFWEVWCPHCKREVPKLQKLYDELKGDGLQVVGLTKVNRSSTNERVQEFIDTEKLSYPVAKEDGSTSAYFSVRGVPAAAVVKGGEVVWRGHPAQLTEAMLKGWL